jgi:hypothetical protein
MIKGSPLFPDSVHDAAKALFLALGEPVRQERWASSFDDSIGCHPVFALAEHFRGHDRGNSGYTGNQYRGDHLSIPGYTETGDVFVLEVSFHKGDTFVERVNFPAGPSNVRDALYSLLSTSETR